MKKVLFSALLLTSMTALAKDHWALTTQTTNKQTNFIQKSIPIEYVKKEYCLQGAYEQWRKYWQNKEFNQTFDLETLCFSKSNKQNFVHIQCDENLSCTFR